MAGVDYGTELGPSWALESEISMSVCVCVCVRGVQLPACVYTFKASAVNHACISQYAAFVSTLICMCAYLALSGGCLHASPQCVCVCALQNEHILFKRVSLDLR